MKILKANHEYFFKLFVLLVLTIGMSRVCLAVVRYVPSEYPSIQSAIAVSVDNDVVELADGTYRENVDYLAKAITLRAEEGGYCEITNGANGYIDITEVNTGTAILEGIHLNNNSCESTARGILTIKNSNVKIIDCTISNNTASGLFMTGKIISIQNSCAEFRDCVISNNHTGDTELFIASNMVINGSSVMMINCSIDNNWTGNTVSCDASSLMMDECTITGNHSIWSGGAINISKSFLELTGSIISRNSSEGNGGGIYLYRVYETVIGGASEKGNVFSENYSFCGKDMFYYPDDNNVVDARYNEFSSFLNESLVRPGKHFNLDGCKYPGTGIYQDVYVATYGSDDNDGISPQTPFGTISHALRFLVPSPERRLTIHIAPGVYSSETTGEVFPIDVYDNVILKGTRQDLTVLQGSHRTTLLKFLATGRNSAEDLTLKGGKSEEGGGISVYFNGSPVISNCLITDNESDFGGAVFVNTSFPTFINCEFSSNQANAGGAIYCNHSSIVALNCVMKNNTAAVSGGGIYCYSGDNRFYECVISGNTAQKAGGVRFYDTDLTNLVSCLIFGNTATEYGGGLASYGAQPEIVNCIIADNESQAESGGIDFRYDDLGTDMTPSIINCTVTGNIAVQGGGVFCSKQSDVVVEGSVVYGNKPDSFLVDEAEPVVSFSDIEGGYPGEGNIDADQLFVEGSEGMYRLSQIASGDIADSPCLDTGRSDAEEVSFFLFGNTINMNQLTTRSDNEVDSGLVDMGYHGHSRDFQLKPAAVILMGNYFSPGRNFEVISRIYNPGSTMKNVPIVFMLTLEDQFYMWPGWSSSLEYVLMDISPGITQIIVFPRCQWPDTGSSISEGNWFYGAMLTSDFTAINGIMGAQEWGYGPAR